MIVFTDTVRGSEIQKDIDRVVYGYMPANLVIDIDEVPHVQHGYPCPHQYAADRAELHEDCGQYCGDDFYSVRYMMFSDLTLADREENGYNDSDFYAIVWDPALNTCRRITYNSTRYAGGGYCVVDGVAAELPDAVAWYQAQVEYRLRDAYSRDAARVDSGRDVEVVGGRKYKGFTGRVTWAGKTQYGERCRIQPNMGKAFFVPIEYCRVLNPEPIDEERLAHEVEYSAQNPTWYAGFTRMGIVMA